MEAAAQYNRLKGGEWFPFLYKKDIIVVGQGGIGSYLTYYLSRIGATLYTFDHDSFEVHNMSGQLVRNTDIDKNKAEAVKALIKELSPDCEIETHGKYTAESFTNDIVVCGLDDMDARLQAFLNWEAQLTPETEKESLFMDGRLLAEMYQIYTITGNNVKDRKRYREEALFTNKEAEEPICTFKQTSHAAGIIAGMMTSFLINWAVNTFGEPDTRIFPYFYEHTLPYNIITKE